MIDRKEIELLIRAQLKGGRDLAAVTKAIAQLEAAIDSQTAAAKKGEGSIDDLKSSLLALKQAQDSLSAQADLIGGFQKLAARIGETEKRVERTTKAYETYKTTLSGLSKVTEEQQGKLQKLSTSQDRANSALASQRKTFEELGISLREIGVDTNNLVAAENRLRDSAAQVGLILGKGQAAIASYADDTKRAREATAQLAAEQANLAKLQIGNENDARLIAEQQAARIKRIEQAEADRLATLEKFGKSQQQQRNALAADSELAAIRESEKFLKDFEESKRKAAAQDAGFRKQAQDAEELARQYSTLARGSKDLRPRVVSLREAIDGITNPAAAARSTLSGLEQEVNAISASIAAGKTDVKDYGEQIKALQAVQKGIGRQADLIDGFKNQLSLLRENRAEFVAARAQVAQYTAAIRQGGDAAATFAKPLADAQARLRGAAAAMRDQVIATRESRDALRQAGVDTANLSNAQQRLVAASRGSTDALRALTGAVEQNGTAAGKAAKGFSLFRDEGRTTLSLAQRIRGEILALTAAYVGVQGVIGLAASSLKAFNDLQGTKSALTFIFGDDPQKVAEELDYIRAQSDRLGVSLQAVSKSYVKFAAAGVKSGASIQEVRFIFESFAEAGRVLNLSADDLNGIFNALGQSFSKGKIQAEELRQQLGERLPGAFAFAQEALKGEFPDLNKALEQGKVGAENLLVIAESVRKAAEGGLSKSIKSLDAEQQRFNNSVLDFKREIAEQGFAESYVNLLKQLTEYLKSTDGKELAKTLADIGSMFLKTISTLVDWRKELGLLLSVFVAFAASGLLLKVGGGFVAFSTALNVATIAATALTPVTLTLASAVKALAAVVGVFIAGYSLGAYLRDQFAEVRVFGAMLVTGMAEIFSKIKFAALELWEGFPNTAANALKRTINVVNNIFARPFLLLFKSIATALGNGGMAKAIDKALDAIVLKLDTGVTDRVAQIRKEAEEDLKRIRDIGNGMVQDALGREGVTLAKDRIGATKSPGKRNGNGLPSEDEIKKRQNEIEALNNALEGIESKTMKKQGETLSSLLDAVDVEYRDLQRRIAALGGKESIEFAKRFEDAKNNLKLEITKDFNKKLLDEQLALQSRIEQAEVASGRKQKLNLDQRLAAIREGYEKDFRDIAKLRSTLIENNRDTAPADQADARLSAAVIELENLERLKFAKEELVRLEARYNEQIKLREGLIAAVRAKQEAGAIDDAEAARQINAINQEALPRIVEAAAASREWAVANKAIFSNEEDFGLFLATLDAAIAKLRQVRTEFSAIEQQAINGAIQAINEGLNTMVDNLGQVLFEQKSVSDAFDDMGKAFLKFVAQFLRDIAISIIKLQIFNALKNSGNPYLAAVGNAGAASVTVKHSGGVIGQASNRNRVVPTSWFSNAPKYHSGGVPGLASDEYAAILKKNEEVLSTTDPRNVMNGGMAAMAAGAASGGTPSARFVLVDDRAKVPEAMNSPEGEQVTMVHVRRNVATLRQLLK